MRSYLLKRLLLVVPTLLGAAALVFLIMRVIPGDVALLIFGGDQAGQPAAPEALTSAPVGRSGLSSPGPLPGPRGAWGRGGRGGRRRRG